MLCAERLSFWGSVFLLSTFYLWLGVLSLLCWDAVHFVYQTWGVPSGSLANTHDGRQGMPDVGGALGQPSEYPRWPCMLGSPVCVLATLARLYEFGESLA